MGIGALVLGRVPDRADAEDEALARHQARDRVDGADRPRIGDRPGGPGEVVGRDAADADLADHVLVRREERGEVEGVGALDVRHEQGAGAVRLRDVDREAEVHVVVADHHGRAVGDAEARAHRRDLADRLHRRVRDQVREAHLAAAGARQVVVEDLAVDLEQLGGDVAHRRRGRDAEARLHVLDDPGCGAADRLRLLAVEHERRGAGQARSVGGSCGSSAVGDGVAGCGALSPFAGRGAVPAGT